jgi:two-component system, response regulator YesN
MRKRIFIRLLVQIFFIVFVVTLFTGILTYLLTSGRIAEDTSDHTAEILDQSKNLVETVLQQIELTAYTVAINSDVISSLSAPWQIEEDYPTLIRVNDLFIDKTHSSSFIHSVCVYSVANDKVISDSGVIDLPLHKDGELISRFIDEKSTSRWLNTREIHPSLPRYADVISFLVKIPINTMTAKGVLILNVVEDFLYNTVVGINSSKLGEVYITDREGTVLSNARKDLLFKRLEYLPEDISELDDEGYYVLPRKGDDQFVSYITSSYNDWIYMAVSSYREVMRVSRLILSVSLMVSGCSFLIGLALSFFVSRFYYRPIKEFVSVLSAYTDREAQESVPTDIDEIEFIDESLRKLMSQNKEFEARFHENRDVLREHFLFDLLLGRESNEKLIRRQCAYFNITFVYGYFVVMILRQVETAGLNGSGIDDKSLITYGLSLKAQDYIQKHCNGKVLARALDELVVLLNFDGIADMAGVTQKSKDIAEEIRRSLGKAVGDAVFIGIGDPYEELTEIRHSYSEALEALNYQGVIGQGNTIHITDLTRGRRGGRKSILAFEVRKERIVVDLKAGNTVGAHQEIEHTLDDISRDRSVSIMQRKVFLFDLANSIINVVAARIDGIDDVFADGVSPLFELDKKNSMEEIKQWFSELVSKSSRIMGEPFKNSSRHVVESIKEYMNEHYFEQIDLTHISEMAKLNARYFCRIFKEETGMTYFEYLTRRRVEAACILLGETDKPIHQVAEEVGFLNKKNIARAFHKFESMRPSEYRSRAVLSALTSSSSS